MTKRAVAIAIAAAALLLSPVAAHAVECRDVFSKIRQRDPFAPFVVGDSVTVPAGDFLGEMGFAVDAVACRTLAQGLVVMSGRRLPDLVVVALGSNAGVSGAELEQALELVGPFGRLVLVLPKALGGGPDVDGRIMRAFQEAHPDQVTVLDWPAYSAGHRDWFAPDGLHLTTDGARGFAQMIGEAVEFGPVEELEPPDVPRRARRAPAGRPGPRSDTAVGALWQALARTVAAIVAPGIRLLVRAIGDPRRAAQPDL